MAQGDTGRKPSIQVGTLARLLMVSPRRVQQLAADGTIPKPSRGSYDLTLSVQGYIRFLQSHAAGNASQVKDKDYHAAKARKMSAEADLAEMEAAKMRADLVPADAVRSHLVQVATEVKTRILNVPQRVAPTLQGETDERKIKATLTEELTQALAAIADAKFTTPRDAQPAAEEDLVDGAAGDGPE